MAKNWGRGGNTGLTGQPPDNCVQLYELGYMVGFFFPFKKRGKCAPSAWLGVKNVGFGLYAAATTEEQFQVNLWTQWTKLKFQGTCKTKQRKGLVPKGCGAC